MPPSRRRPAGPVRKPKVAGLRKPEPRPGTGTDPTEDTQVIPKVPAEPAPEPVHDAPVAEAPPVAAPKPTGRRRPSPGVQPERAAAAVAEPPAVDNVVRERKHGLLLPMVLGVVAVLLGGLAAWFGVNAARAGAGSNVALTDSAATAEVSGQVTSAVNTILSFNYSDLAKTQRAVQRLLTGNALCQYNELYKLVLQQAPSQKLVLTTTVQDRGVEMLQGDTARVLLLVEQRDTRTTTNQTSDSQSMIAVNAVKQSGAWKISAIDTFNGTNAKPCQS
jgi:Mce-associated membrane protein